MLRSRVTALFAAACGGGSDAPEPQGTAGGEPRPFIMGVSSVPQRPSDASYRDAFEFAATAGEVVLIQRVPPWEEFVPGGAISERTERLTRLERVILWQLDIAQRERPGRDVPTAMLYGRVVEHVDVSVEEFQRALSRLVGS